MASAPAVQVRYRLPEAALTLAAMPERTDSFGRDIGGFRGLWQAGGVLLKRYNRAGLFTLVPQFGLRFDPQLQPSGPSRSVKHHVADSDQSDVHLPADSE